MSMTYRTSKRVLTQTNGGVVWRTGLALRLTPEMGAWLEAECAKANRTLANYVETLLIAERERKEPEKKHD